ncbi:hypothetical protein [Rummeliibacillus stabekisii]|uniref:hypothetical protein n=1 Tax=Rummeliibacillus stabekisii TaxID=241244 RepID=UPI0037101AEA
MISEYKESKHRVEYAVYKGDGLLVLGSAKECAEALEVQPEYIQWLTTPTAKKRLAKRKSPDKCITAEKFNRFT